MVHCNVCNVEISSEQCRAKHESGKKHQALAKKGGIQHPPEGRTNGSTSKLHCETCDVILSSERSRKQHEKGKKHQKLAGKSGTQTKPQQKKPTPVFSIHCDLCDVWMSSEGVREKHENGRQHRSELRKIRMRDDAFLHAEETLADLTGLYERVMPLLLLEPPIDVFEASLSSLSKTLKNRKFGPACITCLIRFESEDESDDKLIDHLLTCTCGITFMTKKKLFKHVNDGVMSHRTHIYSKDSLDMEKEIVLASLEKLDQEDPETQLKLHKSKVVFAAKYSLLIHVVHRRGSL